MLTSLLTCKIVRCSRDSSAFGICTTARCNAATTAAAGAVSGEEVFELAEEQLNAGKTAPGRDHAHSPFCDGKAGRGARNLT